MSRLALVMIARNEARCIARCLHSVRPHVDTMIVLDTGSTDDTVAIAQACGATVHHFAWCDDFAAARNAALDCSDADWNLILDADEWLEGDAGALGGATLPAAPVPARFVGCVRIVSQTGADQPAARKYIPRVLPRGVRYEGRIHEQPVSPLPMTILPLAVRHDGFEEAQLARKAGRNEALLRAELEVNSDDSYLWFQLGREHLVRGRNGEAADALLAAHRTCAPDAAWRHGVIVAALQALKRAERFDEALAFADAEHGNWPRSPDFYFAVADLYLDYASHRPDIAMAELLPVVEGAWKRCLEIGERPDLDGSVEGCGSHLAAQNLAMFYETLGIDDDARFYAEMGAGMRARLAA
ncbi:glycosyltransferase family 2 protein [Sphingomonas psychrotolerans]|uniref:Glycosyltransferase family 2 protein n=1 Tax=Sphingomonas psychrotolerans TaxID=1327635 RepID=A0ABU3N3K0_9SPHN|nr:glycosyltransferase family 2 protein [Sphingomonas psychrotolerans]MDT8759102.1 glycosyltransferase family 2 protein [Sphingomonas psychrotolerans]